MTADEKAPAGPIAGLDAQRLDPRALRSLSELLEGDQDALGELVDAFVEEAPQRLVELRVGFDNHDAAAISRAAHTLKSNALTFGASRLGQLCLELEAVARAGELGEAPRLTDEIDAEWRRVEPALRALPGLGPP